LEARAFSATSDKPSAKASLSKYLDGGKKLLLTGRVYDIEAIADKFNLKRADHCWPVLLSTKPGAKAKSPPGAHAGTA
jgi:hypothetical protein